ncbi:hypothetical protein MNBD_GAMMA08-3148 [hydrothermal vent metagenome]|uniref:Uncharacterized protein n=1 Tax=hydrothermal vent metagenome TaxID=652676 RepID=A0A3B0WYQ1_9ZZZZ
MEEANTKVDQWAFKNFIAYLLRAGVLGIGASLITFGIILYLYTPNDALVGLWLYTNQPAYWLLALFFLITIYLTKNTINYSTYCHMGIANYIFYSNRLACYIYIS